jgi:hypothetical protein
MSRDGGAGGGLVNEQGIMKLSDIVALQSMKATYCETVDDCAGDAAVGRWTIMARLKRRGSTVPDTLYGRYQDEFRRTPQGWRISSVRFIQES